ncbi:hypothetical protein [Streptomyces triculaminicus]|uniref:hypothetical protein n=1 Tax=Streptomyces triculaminicus TaxID=2816232 RepID=UPI0037D2E5FA
MAVRKTNHRTAKAKSCPDCAEGQVSTTFKVGGRKKRESHDHQEALCLTCMGTGEAPESA